ncbi:MAG: BatA domain-containing protein [Pirellulales bacterium]|nr:BatA domain-containing protein [Pirellulales bacterium]
MTLLNGILAFGAAAFAIPLLIHLLNRSRFRTVEWGAMHLLESVLRVNQRRVRLEQIILLLVRCAIPAVLAFCLARPVLTGWQTLPGDAPASTVILLDNSYSMDVADNGRKRLAEAIDQAGQVVAALARGSEIAVVQTGGKPQPVLDRPIFDVKTMIQQLRLVRGGYGAADPAESLEAGLGILSGMANARRDLVYFSDFQHSDWDATPRDRLQRIRRRIEEMPIRPTVTFVDLGRSVEENVSVDSLEFSTRALGVDEDLQIRATLRNHGPRAHDAARARFRIDGLEQSASQIALPAKAAAQVLFTCRFKTPGSHLVEVEAAVDDRLPTDNRYAAAVPVLERIGVLLVDGAPSDQPLEGETDFLSVALTPYTFGRAKLSDLIETKTVPPGELNEKAVAGARVVVLANVPKLSDDQVGLLGRYVHGGGSLLVFSGNKIDIAWYNKALYSDGSGLLPMTVDAAAGSGQADAKSSRIVAQHFEHPALEIFNDRENGNLADAEIRKWYRLSRVRQSVAEAGVTPVSTGASSEPFVLARLETGDPLIVQRRIGEGLVVQVATACDAEWSNLPMRPIYLPLMQHLITTMASQVVPPCNFEAGRPLVAVLPGESQAEPLALTSPDGTRRTVRPVARGTQSMVEYARTLEPGVYTLVGSDARPLHFVARTPRAESDLRMLDEKRLASLAADLGADVVRSGREYLELDRSRRHGREIWKYLLAGVLGLMFLELVLQQRFARVRT